MIRSFYEIGEMIEENGSGIKACLKAIERGERAKEFIRENIKEQENLLKEARKLLEEVEL